MSEATETTAPAAQNVEQGPAAYAASAEIRRQTALYAAIQLHANHHVPSAEIVGDAKAFEAFLAGETEAAPQ